MPQRKRPYTFSTQPVKAHGKMQRGVVASVSTTRFGFGPLEEGVATETLKGGSFAEDSDDSDADTSATPALAASLTADAHLLQATVDELQHNLKECRHRRFQLLTLARELLDNERKRMDDEDEAAAASAAAGSASDEEDEPAAALTDEPARIVSPSSNVDEPAVPIALPSALLPSMHTQASSSPVEEGLVTAAPVVASSQSSLPPSQSSTVEPVDEPSDLPIIPRRQRSVDTKPIVEEVPAPASSATSLPWAAAAPSMSMLSFSSSPNPSMLAASRGNNMLASPHSPNMASLVPPFFPGPRNELTSPVLSRWDSRIPPGYQPPDHRSGPVPDPRSSGNPEHRSGNMLDHRGPVLDQRGPIVDHRGQMVDHRGQMVDHRGQMVDHRGPVPDRSGPMHGPPMGYQSGHGSRGPPGYDRQMYPPRPWHDGSGPQQSSNGGMPSRFPFARDGPPRPMWRGTRGGFPFNRGGFHDRR